MRFDRRNLKQMTTHAQRTSPPALVAPATPEAPAPTSPSSNSTYPPPDAMPVLTPPPSESPPPPPDAPPPSVTPPPDALPPPDAPSTPSSPPPKDAPPPPDAPPTPSSPPPKDAPPPDATPPPPPEVKSPPPPSSPPPDPTPTPTPPLSPGVESPPPPPTMPPPPPGKPVIRSPPPPHINIPPPPGINRPPPPGTPTESSSWIAGSVIWIAVGGVAVLLLLCLLCFCCKKKKRRRHSDDFYVQTPQKSGSHGGRQQQWQQNLVPPSEHKVTTPPTPYSPQPTLKPPPPPPFTSSSGSRSNYSGSENPPLPPPSPGLSLGFSKSTFTYEELGTATNGFSDTNLLGQGGFGYVHFGVLPNGKEVAVKSLKAGSGQGEREFQAEVEIISRVHHRHLVSLVGYCIAGSQRMLVYEFLPNNTMEFLLHEKGRPTMNWPSRLKIALGSAKGLAYLHEDCHPKIIHRDIKASNILLDSNFEAKVADFGLAKMNSDVNTHVSTRVMGTFGYLAPEYASSGKLTEKSDVFSYGVMLLELITGRRPVNSTDTYMDDSLVDWARPRLMRAMEDENFDSLVDPRLEGNYNEKEMLRMVACAAACVRYSAKRRPKMSQIVRALEGDASLSDLNEGVRPGNSSVFSGSSESEYNEQMKQFRKTAFETSEYCSSDYSAGLAATSEYGLNPSCSSSQGQNTREMEMGTSRKLPHQGFSGSS